MKKKFIIPICFILVLLMAACTATPNSSEKTGQQTNSNEEADSNDTVKTIEDMKGTAEIPKNPQRIVDVSGSADELIVMGVPFIGSANTSMFDGVTVPDYLQDYFRKNEVEVVGNYSGTMDLNLEKIAELKPDLIIMNIRHEKVYDQLKAIAPTVMLSDDINFVDWRGRFQQLGEWFGKEDVVAEWLETYDAKAAELAEQVKAAVGDESFAVIEANSVHFGSYYVYRTAGPGDLIFNELKLKPSAGVPENVWGEVVDAEYFSKIDAEHIFYFSDDGKLGDTANSPTWQNLKAVKNGNVYYGLNNNQYNMAYTPNGKLLYMEKMAQAIINHTNVDDE
ncbi:ABC transporter substrate-binding protein [Faecalicatena contorta]|uniref:Iron complex transport system substrate-binding protein n=1 Tax=Faecalicatena contorta TaxID=39482 RepID=A0A315ZPT7_9FIRM|nr:ABC transporter substrate-binding protein [Faecalicatena contorta]PWJ47312.1 iron complex transport system substrate-binding protein [Faecalicatena contorta]SUQ16026.1 iron complex transport system substrate-binding protein [Faecalicatena contorta]